MSCGTDVLRHYVAIGPFQTSSSFTCFVNKKTLWVVERELIKNDEGCALYYTYVYIHPQRNTQDYKCGRSGEGDLVDYLYTVVTWLIFSSTHENFILADYTG